MMMQLPSLHVFLKRLARPNPKITLTIDFPMGLCSILSMNDGGGMMYAHIYSRLASFEHESHHRIKLDFVAMVCVLRPLSTKAIIASSSILLRWFVSWVFCARMRSSHQAQSCCDGLCKNAIIASSSIMLRLTMIDGGGTMYAHIHSRVWVLCARRPSHQVRRHVHHLVDYSRLVPDMFEI